MAIFKRVVVFLSCNLQTTFLLNTRLGRIGYLALSEGERANEVSKDKANLGESFHWGGEGAR